MNAALELHVAPAGESPLAHARVHRQLTVEEAARRAGLSPEVVQWLEEGRVYRFPSTDDALISLLLYATALGIDHDEALALAGRPVPPRPLRRNPWPRLVALVALAGAVTALVAVLATSGHGHAAAQQAASAKAVSTLPAPWAIKVEVLNGSGDITATRALASRIGALGYSIRKVGPANNFRYQQTIVYYPPGAEAIALRLARQLGVQVAPLPGGTDSRRLVVIAGPATIG